MPIQQPTISKFSTFYRQSCQHKRQRSNETASQQGQAEAKAWLGCLSSDSRPRWCNAQTVANLSCAMRNYRFTIRKDRAVLVDLLRLIGEFVEGFNAQDIANSLLALNQMGVRWDYLPKGLDEKLWAAVSRNAKDFNAQEFANSLLALDQMGVRWGDLPRGLDKKLWAAVSRNAKDFNAQAIANSLLALNQMGVRWGDLPRGLDEKLWAAVSRNAQDFNAQAIANSLLALNQMGVRWCDLPKSLSDNLWVAVSRNAQDFNAQNIANSLLALNQMGLRWGDLPRGLDEKLWAAVYRNAQDFNAQNIANSLLALNQMSVRWGDLPRGLDKKLWAAVSRNAQDFNAQAIANSLLALNQMGLCWGDLPKRLSDNLWAAVSRNAQDFNAQAIVNSLLALDQMGVRWGDLPRGLDEKLWAAVSRNAQDFNAQNIANSLLALNQMGVRWGDLPRGLNEKLWAAVSRNAQDFNAQGIANSLLAYVRMHDDKPRQGFDKQTYQRVLSQLIKSAQSIMQQTIMQQSVKNKEKRQIAQALTWLQAFHDEDYSQEFQGICLTKEVKTSQLQKSVVAALRGLEPQVVIEEEKGLGFAGCLDVDIFIPEKNLVIEVDGPHHYDKAGRLDQVAMQKQQLLEKMGLIVKRIVYKQWDNLDPKGKKSLLEQCLIKTSATEDLDLSVRSDFAPVPGNQAAGSTMPVKASGLQATATVFVPKASNHNTEKAESTGEKSLPDDKSGVLSTQHDSLCKKADEPINCRQGASAVGLFTHHEERTSKIDKRENATPTQKTAGVEDVPQVEDISHEGEWQTVTKKSRKHRQKKSSMDKARNGTQNASRK